MDEKDFEELKSFTEGYMKGQSDEDFVELFVSLVAKILSILVAMDMADIPPSKLPSNDEDVPLHLMIFSTLQALDELKQRLEEKPMPWYTSKN